MYYIICMNKRELFLPEHCIIFSLAVNVLNKYIIVSFLYEFLFVSLFIELFTSYLLSEIFVYFLSL